MRLMPKAKCSFPIKYSSIFKQRKRLSYRQNFPRTLTGPPWYVPVLVSHYNVTLIYVQRQTPNHPLFYVPELLSQVVDSYRGPRKGLVSLALVSKGFSHPALDAIWKRMNIITPLIRLLPKVDFYDESLLNPTSSFQVDGSLSGVRTPFRLLVL